MSNKPTVKQAHKAEIAYKYYINEGWTPEQASGIVGSLVTESGNFSEDVISGKRLGDGGKAFGIAQWHPNRQAKAKELYGDKWKDFNKQLAFVNWELNNTESKAGKKLRSAKTVWEAGATFANEYERPKLKFVADNKRQKNVTDIYSKYSKSKLTENDKKLFLNNSTSYFNSVAPHIENTPTFINFEIPQNNTNFADVGDVYIEQKQEVSEPLQKLKENSFLEEYAQLQGQQPQFIQQYEQPTPIMATDVYGMAENVERMVAQQGGEKNSLWKNIRANRGSGKKPTKEMLEQETKIKRAQQGIIKDDEGYWNPENQGKVVEIQGSEITMKNVYEPLLGISNQTGEKKIMLPNKNYSFNNTKQVTEYPIITEKERAFINKYKNKK